MKRVNKKIYRHIALVLMVIMVFGSTLTAQAHEHEFTKPAGSVICYDSFSGGTHPYISGYTYSPKGEILPIYSMCETVIYKYKQYRICATCNAAWAYHYSSKKCHINCGAATEYYDF